MFLKVKVNDLNMLINLGQDLEQASSLVTMFEKNAKFVKESYNAVELVEPESSILLGESIDFTAQGYNNDVSHLVISATSDVVGCVDADNHALICLDKIRAKYKAQVDALKKALDLANKKIQGLEAQVEELEGQED
jgi:hypothetical protein